MSLLDPGLGTPMRALAACVRGGVPVIGTFVKTNSHQVVELLARSGLDFVILDAEHAPFGVESLDRCLAAAHGAGLPALVRVPDKDAAFINACLDMGAAGIVVPHVQSSADVEAIADAARYARGKRGFSPSSRAGNYGDVDHDAYRAAADADAMIWCQVEDAGALDQIDEIAANPACDGLFIGPADLGLSLGCDGPGDPRLEQAIRAIADAGRRHGRRVALFVPGTDPIPDRLAQGITIFICGSDQSLLLGRARQLVAALSATGPG